MNDPDPITALINKSYALELAGDVSRALQSAQDAVKLARAAGEDEGIAAALVCTAHCHHHLGHYDAAQRFAEEALACTAAVSRSRADALRILGSCAHERGDLSTAEDHYHRAIDLARQLGHHHALQSCLHSLSACVYIPRGQFELALAADEESLRLALDLNMVEVAWFPLVTIGWVYWITGRRGRALKTVADLRRFVQPGSLGEGYYYCLLADLTQDGEEPAAALPLYARARSIAELVGDPGLNAELRVGLSRYHRAAGNAPVAYDWADDALNISDRTGSQDLQGWALIERGHAAWQMADFARAQADLEAAIKLLTPMQAHYDLARAYFLLAAFCQQQDHARAESAWLEAASHIISGGYAFLLEKNRSLAFPLLAGYLISDDPDVVKVSNRLLSQLASVSPPPLRIHTLGWFEVWQGNRPVPDHAWRQRRAGELFRLLLVGSGYFMRRPESRSLSRDQIIEALWPDKQPASSQALFHRATSALRRVLEPDIPDKFPSRYLTVDRGQVSLNLPEGSQVDFEAFEESVSNQEWEAALDLYQGDLFPDDLYADWAATRREQLKHAAVRAALERAREALAASHPDVALAACRRALALEPWQEEAVLLGMQACVARNDRAGAIRLYLKLERSLRVELNIAPQEALQQFYRSLL